MKKEIQVFKRITQSQLESARVSILSKLTSTISSTACGTTGHSIIDWYYALFSFTGAWGGTHQTLGKLPSDDRNHSFQHTLTKTKRRQHEKVKT